MPTPIVCVGIAEIDSKLVEHVGGVESLLDVGCGIWPQTVFRINRHVALEPYPPYAAIARAKGVEVYEHDACQGLPFPDASFQLVWLGDVIEHLTKEDGGRLFNDARRVASLGVVVRTPLGFQPQTGDAWALGGEHWQLHRSGWRPDEFDSERVWIHYPEDCKQGWFVSFSRCRHTAL